MSGIRERKKERTRREILRCAEELFSRRGFGDTTMEEIGEAALVGVGTLYNYFGGKGDLLVAIMASKTEQVLEATASCIPGPHERPTEAATELLTAYVSGFLAMDLGLVREAISLAIAHPQRMGQRMLELDMLLIGQLSELLARLQEEGLVSPSIDPERVSFALYAQGMTYLMLWTQTEPPSHDKIRSEIGDMVELLFCDWRKGG